MHASSECPTVVACRLLGGSTAGARLADDTSSGAALASAPPASAPAPTLRGPRRSARPRRGRRRWPGSAGRRGPGGPGGTPCRPTRRSASWVIPSLCCAAPPVTSQRPPEVVGSSPISWLWLLRTLTWNGGPFPPPALPGLTGTTDLSATPVGPACPSRASGWAHAPTAGASRVASASRCGPAVVSTPARPRTCERSRSGYRSPWRRPCP